MGRTRRWLRIHRKGARVFCTTAAVIPLTLLAIGFAARVAADNPPRIAPGVAVATPLPSATATVHSVIEVDAPSSWIVVLAVIILIAAIGRVAITDKRLGAGDVSVVTDRRDRESALKNELAQLSDPDAQRRKDAELHALLQRRVSVATSTATERVAQIISTRDPSASKASRLWHGLRSNRLPTSKKQRSSSLTTKATPRATPNSSTSLRCGETRTPTSTFALSGTGSADTTEAPRSRRRRN